MGGMCCSVEMDLNPLHGIGVQRSRPWSADVTMKTQIKRIGISVVLAAKRGAGNHAVLQERDDYNQPWLVDTLLTRQNRGAVAKTIWIVGKTMVPRAL